MTQVHTASPKVTSQSTCDLSQAGCSKFPLAVTGLSYKDMLSSGPVKRNGTFSGKSMVKTTCVLNKFKISDSGRALNRGSGGNNRDTELESGKEEVKD